MRGNSNKKLIKIRSYFVILIGTFLTALAVSVFQLPNKIVSGGVGGIATICYHLLHAEPGLTIACINIILLILSYRVLGKVFVLKTLVGAGLYSCFVQVLSYLPPITEDMFINAVFGGALYGLGIGMTLVSGSTTGGTDILARLLQKKFPSLPVGQVLLMLDGCIILTSIIVFRKFELGIMGIVSIVVSTYIIDSLVKTLNNSKLIYVVTDNPEKIAFFLVETSPRGVTILSGKGAYSMQEKGVLICAMKGKEVEEFKRKILRIDAQAFLIVTNSEKIFGNGFFVHG